MSFIIKIFDVIKGALAYFYLTKCRPCFKFFLRKFTGVHEIERAVCNDDVRDFRLCIFRSKELVKVRTYFESGYKKDDTLNIGIVDEIYKIKNIVHTKENVESFVRTATKLFNHLKSKQYLEEVRTTVFLHSNVEDQNKLRKFWNLMTDSKPLPNIITREWIDIGFQGEDPATDFRGAGMLGLDNLIYFAETYPEIAQPIFKRACDPKHQYFFAAAGLYLTLEIRSLINDGHFEAHFYAADNKEKTLKAFGDIYTAVFKRFDEYWVDQPNANFMQFNTIIGEFFSVLRRNLADISILVLENSKK